MVHLYSTQPLSSCIVVPSTLSADTLGIHQAVTQSGPKTQYHIRETLTYSSVELGVSEKLEIGKRRLYTLSILSLFTQAGHRVFITSRGKQYATTCFLSFHPSIHLFHQWFALNRTMQREAAVCACGKVCVCQCVFAPAVVQRTI